MANTAFSIFLFPTGCILLFGRLILLHRGANLIIKSISVVSAQALEVLATDETLSDGYRELSAVSLDGEGVVTLRMRDVVHIKEATKT